MYHHVPPIFYSENCQLSQAIPSSETSSITVRGRTGQQSIRIKERSFAQTFKIWGPLSCATGTELLTMSSSARLRCYLNPHEIIFANVYKSIMISRYYLDTISISIPYLSMFHLYGKFHQTCPHNVPTISAMSIPSVSITNGER